MGLQRAEQTKGPPSGTAELYLSPALRRSIPPNIHGLFTPPYKCLDKTTAETLKSSDLGCFPYCNGLNKTMPLPVCLFFFDSLVLCLDGTGSIWIPSSPQGAEASPACLSPPWLASWGSHGESSPGLVLGHLSMVAWKRFDFGSV